MPFPMVDYVASLIDNVDTLAKGISLCISGWICEVIWLGLTWIPLVPPMVLFPTFYNIQWHKAQMAILRTNPHHNNPMIRIRGLSRESDPHVHPPAQHQLIIKPVGKRYSQTSRQ